MLTEAEEATAKELAKALIDARASFQRAGATLTRAFEIAAPPPPPRWQLQWFCTEMWLGIAIGIGIGASLVMGGVIR